MFLILHQHDRHNPRHKHIAALPTSLDYRTENHTVSLDSNIRILVTYHRLLQVYTYKDKDYTGTGWIEMMTIFCLDSSRKFNIRCKYNNTQPRPQNTFQYSCCSRSQTVGFTNNSPKRDGVGPISLRDNNRSTTDLTSCQISQYFNSFQLDHLLNHTPVRAYVHDVHVHVRGLRSSWWVRLRSYSCQ